MAALSKPAPAIAPSEYRELLQQFIGGAWRQGRGEKTVSSKNPWSGEKLTELQAANLDDLNEAYEQAQKAQKKWISLLPMERAKVMRAAAKIMEQRREEIMNWIIRESGGTRLKAELEVESAIGITYESASFPHHIEGRILPIDVPGKESRAYRQPLGVVGVISPFNFPFHLSMRSVSPALACGNAVVLKPAELTLVTGGLLLGKIFEEAGVPPGVMNVVVGPSSEIGNAFSEHPVPRLISFTGSTAVGVQIGKLAMGSKKMKKVSLELGGNAPFVVLDDADLEQAVNSAIFGRFMHQGQICMGTNRLLVDAKLYEPFVERFTERASKLKVGTPETMSDPDTVIGPIISDKQLQHALELVKKGLEEGARQTLGGEPKGLILPPQVFADVRNDSEFAQTEAFAAVCGIVRFDGDAEGLALANQTEEGLSSTVFSRDESRALAFALQVEAGMTHINDTTVEDYPNNPFGGEKNSGLGRFGGHWVIDEFTTDHWITVQHTPRRYPF